MVQKNTLYYSVRDSLNSINMPIVKSKGSETRKKIIFGMNKVQDELLAFKKRINSELVVMEGDKIVRISPDQVRNLKK